MRASEERTEWTKPFEELVAFASRNEDIVVTRESLIVPAEERVAFYGLVEQVQKALLDTVAGARVDVVREAATRLAQVRRELERRTGLGAYRLASSVENLLDDLECALSKPAFGIVLDGLQQNLKPEEIEAAARDALSSFCETMVRNAYEAWAYCRIVLALEPTKFYAVTSPDTVEARAIPTDVVVVGAQVTSPERRMPEAVFETASGNVYAMKTEVARELDFYSARITRRRDFSAGGNTVDQIAHRVLLLYRIPSVEEVPLIADRDKLAVLPSDLMCEVLHPREMERPAYVSQFVERINAVRSKRPVQVITFDEQGNFPEGMLDDPSVAPVARTAVGFDERKLEAIAGLLTSR